MPWASQRFCSLQWSNLSLTMYISSPLSHILQLECPRPETWQLAVWNCWHINDDATFATFFPLYWSGITKHWHIHMSSRLDCTQYQLSWHRPLKSESVDHGALWCVPSHKRHMFSSTDINYQGYCYIAGVREPRGPTPMETMLCRLLMQQLTIEDIVKVVQRNRFAMVWTCFKKGWLWLGETRSSADADKPMRRHVILGRMMCGRVIAYFLFSKWRPSTILDSHIFAIL